MDTNLTEILKSMSEKMERNHESIGVKFNAFERIVVEMKEEVLERVGWQVQQVEQKVSNIEQQVQQVREECRLEIQKLRQENEREKGMPLQSTLLDLSMASATAGSARSCPQQKAPIFDGRTTWEAYAAQFEIIAEINGWNEAERAQFLVSALRGGTLNTLSNLNVGQRRNYGELVRAFKRRYGASGQPELAKSKLRARAQRRDEKLPELAEDVERLTRLAYPDVNEETLDSLAMDQFLDALRDEDVRKEVLMSRPTGLRQALETAIQVESISSYKRPASRLVRSAAIEDHTEEEIKCAAIRTPTRDPIQDDPKFLMKEILSELRSWKLTKRPEIKCWRCGENGHIQAQCNKDQLSTSNNQKNFRKSLQRGDE
jgi:hypothetical protein